MKKVNCGYCLIVLFFVMLLYACAPAPTATEMSIPTTTLSPTVSGDAPFTVYSHPELSGKIAFAGGDGAMNLYTMSADGTGLRQFIGIDWAVNPAWSPDGKQIAYCPSNKSADNDVIVVNDDGSGRRLLLANVGDTCGLFWEPDGQRIRFVSRSEDGKNCVYVVKADGSGAAELYNPFNIPELCDESGILAAMTWAPDGTKFAFHTRHVDGIVRVLNIDGSKIGVLLPGPSLHWSPDGSKLALVRGGNGINIVNSDGSEDILLLRLNTPVPDPWGSEGVGIYDLTWSPDGKKIAIIDFCEIAVIDIDSGNLTKLVDGCTVDPRYFFWSISWTR